MALANHEVPYFHMREMAKPRGVFAKWLPPSDHQDELADFFSGLAKVVRDSCLVGVLSLVRIDDLERFNAEYGTTLEPYPLAAYGCMLMAARDNPGMSTELIFDHCEGIGSKLAKARTYAVSDTYNDGDFTDIVVSPLVNSLTCKDVPALQAADFFVWEYGKNHTNVSTTDAVAPFYICSFCIPTASNGFTKSSTTAIAIQVHLNTRTKEGLHPKRAGLDQALYRNCWRARHTRTKPSSMARWSWSTRGGPTSLNSRHELAAGRQGRLVYYAFDLLVAEWRPSQAAAD